MKFNMDLSGLESRLNSRIPSIEAELHKTLFQGANRIKNEAKRQAPKHEGELKRGIGVSNQSVPQKIRYIVYSKAPHSKFVEFGTGPRSKMPPPDALRKWVYDKILKGTRTRKQGGTKKAKKRTVQGKAKKPKGKKIRISKKMQKELNRLVFLIGRHIAKHGTKAQPFFRPAYFKNESWLKNEARKAFRRGLRSGRK